MLRQEVITNTKEYNYGSSHISTANCLENLARVFERKGDYDAALSTLDSSLAIKMAINPSSWRWQGYICQSGLCMRNQTNRTRRISIFG